MFEGFQTFDIDAGETVIHGVMGGEGPPLLLLHGFPQTHVMWHKIAPRLAEHYTVVATDLRGYGDSGKPQSDASHSPYSFRAMAADQVAVMRELGFDRFRVAAHDRGARVTHRMMLDHPDVVARAAIMDIIPTFDVYRLANQVTATGYYHWFFLIQPADLPERLIGADPEYYLRRKTSGMGRTGAPADGHFTPAAMAEYIRCYSKPETIHATCEDYRAGAGIDLEHDTEDRDRKVQCPVLVLWGANGMVGREYDVLSIWREQAENVRGRALDCGHYLPEEQPDDTLSELLAFMGEVT